MKAQAVRVGARCVVALVLGLIGLVGLLVASCATPTSLRLDVFSEVPCEKNALAVVITAGSLGELSGSAPSATSTRCDPDGRLGSVVIAPGGANDATIALALMTRPDGQSADSCLEPSQAAGCIVAKRRLRFERHHEITMRLDLRLSCLGVSCGESETCVRGVCVGADIQCGSSCDETALPPVVPPDAAPDVAPGAVDGGGDATGPEVPDVAVYIPTAAIDAGPLPEGGFAKTTGAVAVGLEHACALFDTGQVGCWGNNGKGQLGDGTTTSRTQMASAGVPRAIAVAAGDDFSCALLETGRVMCWGGNARGQLGDGSMRPFSATPTEVKDVAGATALALGSAHGCVSALQGPGDYRAKCWGANDKGQLGNATIVDAPTPVIPDVTMSQAPLLVGAGAGHSCAGSGTKLRCWGDNSSGQLGNGTVVSSQTPVEVAGQFDLSGVSLGATSSCMVTTSTSNPPGGTRVRCWGSNKTGELGDNATKSSLVPKLTAGVDVPVTAPDGGSSLTAGSGVEVAVGEGHGCFAAVTGHLVCWGQNDVGQLGGVPGAPRGPSPVVGVVGVTSVSARSRGSCATSAASVVCFGTAASFGGGGS